MLWIIHRGTLSHLYELHMHCGYHHKWCKEMLVHLTYPLWVMSNARLRNLVLRCFPRHVISELYSLAAEIAFALTSSSSNLSQISITKSFRELNKSIAVTTSKSAFCRDLLTESNLCKAVFQKTHRKAHSSCLIFLANVHTSSLITVLCVSSSALLFRQL